MASHTRTQTLMCKFLISDCDVTCAVGNQWNTDIPRGKLNKNSDHCCPAVAQCLLFNAAGPAGQCSSDHDWTHYYTLYIVLTNRLSVRPSISPVVPANRRLLLLLLLLTVVTSSWDTRERNVRIVVGCVQLITFFTRWIGSDYNNTRHGYECREHHVRSSTSHSTKWFDMHKCFSNDDDDDDVLVFSGPDFAWQQLQRWRIVPLLLPCGH